MASYFNFGELSAEKEGYHRNIRVQSKALKYLTILTPGGLRAISFFY